MRKMGVVSDSIGCFMRACAWGLLGFAAAQAAAAHAPVPTDLKSNLAWWSADDRGTNATIGEATVPAALTSWADPKAGFMVTSGLPDPMGGTNAYSMVEKSVATWRWLSCAPTGYVSGPCKIEFLYKSINGASVRVFDGTTFAPQFEFAPDGVGRAGAHPYSYAFFDNMGFSVTPAANGFHRVDLWFQGSGHIRTSVALSTVSNESLPPAGDPGKGVCLYGLRFSQRYVTALRDRSSHGTHLAGPATNAPFFQRSGEAANLLTGGSCFWEPDGNPKYLTTTNAALCAALSGTAPCTVLALVRRQWCRFEPGGPAAFLQAVSGSSNDYSIGFMAATTLTGCRLYAGAPGVAGPVSTATLDTEWNVVAAINSGTTASLYLLDNAGATLLAGPTAVSRGTASSVRVGAQRCALRELAVWGEALDVKAAQEQAIAMIDRAGGQAVLNTFRTLDGVTVETRTKTAPYAWRDDAGTAFFNGACWILGGAVDNTCGLTNDVWKSTDYGVTWTRVPQVKPFDPAACAAAFPLTVGGTNYLYFLNFANRSHKSSTYRSTDGTAWSKVCDDPPWETYIAMGAGVLGTNIYVMGGQASQYDRKSATSRVHKSSDGGVTWTSLGDAPWRPRLSFGPTVSTWKGKLWLVHGGTMAGFGGVGGEMYDDVWAFDGVKWECVLEHTPFPGSFWFTNFVLDNDLFIMGGREGDGHDHRTMWRTSDGVHWRPSFPLPWGIAHECCATETDRGILLAPTDWNQTTRLLK